MHCCATGAPAWATTGIVNSGLTPSAADHSTSTAAPASASPPRSPMPVSPSSRYGGWGDVTVGE